MSENSLTKRTAADPVGGLRALEPVRLMREMLGFEPLRDLLPQLSGGSVAVYPAFEVKETKDAFVFKADLPGVKESDLEVSVAGNRLTISGKREAEKEEQQETYYAYERAYGSFVRTFTLPEQVDAEHVRAEIQAGELTVVVPKSATAKATKIPVAAGKEKKS
jgi:HSP20 family protein